MPKPQIRNARKERKLLLPAAQRFPADLFPIASPSGLRQDLRGNKQRHAVGLRGLLDLRRHVHRIAQHGELDPSRIADKSQ